MKILLPHIGYTVYVKDKKTAKGKVKEYLKNMNACAVRQKYSSTIYIKLPIKGKQIPTFCHELIHIMQFICNDLDIDFTKEQEHIAYIFQYILNAVLGYEYFV